jgi:hypothetical protein
MYRCARGTSIYIPTQYSGRGVPVQQASLQVDRGEPTSRPKGTDGLPVSSVKLLAKRLRQLTTVLNVNEARFSRLNTKDTLMHFVPRSIYKLDTPLGWGG